MTEQHPTPETEKSPAFPWLEWTNIREHLAALTERVASLMARVVRMEERFNTRLGQIREEFNTRLDQIREDVNARFTRLEEGFNTRLDQIREESNTRFTRLEGDIKDLREEVKSVKSLLIWILIANITVGGGIIAALLMK